MKLCLDSEIVGPWVCHHTKGTWLKGRGAAIGAVRGADLIAGVLYEDWNHANVVCHIAGIGSWASREYLWHIFNFPFNQLGVRRITVPICSTNAKSIALVEKMGFILEATLHQATPDGDLLIYRLFKDECKYIKGKYRWESQAHPRRTTRQPPKKLLPAI